MDSKGWIYRQFFTFYTSQIPHSNLRGVKFERVKLWGIRPRGQSPNGPVGSSIWYAAFRRINK